MTDQNSVKISATGLSESSLIELHFKISLRLFVVTQHIFPNMLEAHLF